MNAGSGRTWREGGSRWASRCRSMSTAGAPLRDAQVFVRHAEATTSRYDGFIEPVHTALNVRPGASNGVVCPSRTPRSSCISRFVRPD
jgi:hypothetical protein